MLDFTVDGGENYEGEVGRFSIWMSWKTYRSLNLSQFSTNLTQQILLNQQK